MEDVMNIKKLLSSILGIGTIVQASQQGVPHNYIEIFVYSRRMNIPCIGQDGSFCIVSPSEDLESKPIQTATLTLEGISNKELQEWSQGGLETGVDKQLSSWKRSAASGPLRKIERREIWLTALDNAVRRRIQSVFNDNGPDRAVWAILALKPSLFRNARLQAELNHTEITTTVSGNIPLYYESEKRLLLSKLNIYSRMPYSDSTSRNDYMRILDADPTIIWWHMVEEGFLIARRENDIADIRLISFSH
jgi:hypothetical protein